MNEDTTKNTRIAITTTPGRAAMAYLGHDPEIPPLKADIETHYTKSGWTYQVCRIYIGSEMVAHMTISRGKAFAVRMVRGALKGAMSRLGHHRRLTANKAKRRAAAKEE